MPVIDTSICTGRDVLYACVVSALKQAGEKALVKEYARRAESVEGLNALMQLSRQYVRLVNRLGAMS